MKKQLGITLALSLGLLASHAAMANDAVLGALVGGGAGVLVGRSVGGRDGALIGGALGAAAGAVIASQHNRPRVAYGPPAYAAYYAPPAYYPAQVYYAPQAYYAPQEYYRQPVHYVRGDHERWHRDDWGHRGHDRDDHRR
jgi:hypothetical protein